MTKTIEAHGQKIEGASPAHFMDREAGKGTGFAIVPVTTAVIFEHEEGKLPKRALRVKMFGFLAVHRKYGSCLKGARAIATFFHN